MFLRFSNKVSGISSSISSVLTLEDPSISGD
jgi:hypothetical protein